jgi:hypothetical protein
MPLQTLSHSHLLLLQPNRQMLNPHVALILVLQHLYLPLEENKSQDMREIFLLRLLDMILGVSFVVFFIWLRTILWIICLDLFS